jgi:uncharacterized protein YjiS (DUF1127 family)
MSLTCPDTIPQRSVGVAGRLFRPFGRAGMALADGCARINNGLQTWLDRARQRRALQELNDHVLKDIGISRCDVFRESSKFFWHE